MTARPRLRRTVLVLAAIAAAASSQAFADTQSTSPTVSVAVATGARALQVTGVDSSIAPLPSSAASLALNSTTTQAPFGVIVTDLAHSRAGYQVDATLSNLYRLDPANLTATGAARYVCADAIPSSAFTVAFPRATSNPADSITALVRSNLTFVDPDLTDNLLGLTGSLSTVVSDLTAEKTTTLAMMSVANGAGGAFTTAASHACAAASGTPTSQRLQDGTTTNPDLSGLATALFTQADTDSSTALTAAEAIAGELITGGSNQPGGELYDETKAALSGLVSSLGLLGVDLDVLTADVIADMTATAAPVLDLLGQSGLYLNTPQLVLDPAAVAGKTTGTYQGTMTVTLTDK